MFDNFKTTNTSKWPQVPPLSVIDSRTGYWQRNKQKWISLGIKSELGRNVTLLKTAFFKNDMNKRKQIEKQPILSIFDPFLCEVIYYYYCFPSGTAIDPFAGGSVRGIVAKYSGLNYYGIDLSDEQVRANKNQKEEILRKHKTHNTCNLVWLCGDSKRLLKNLPKGDLIFSCPPYWKLEKYSDNKDDLSNMAWDDFSKNYKKIIKEAVKRLKRNRFAVFVVGNIIDKGKEVDLVHLTKKYFNSAGTALHNEIIFMQPANTATLRGSYSFKRTRRVAKVHQHILIFIKGNVKKATQVINKRREN